MIRFMASLVVMFVCFSPIFAQDIVSHIPDNVPIVMSFDAENAKKKITMQELTELNIYKSLEEKMTQNEKDKEIFEFLSKFYKNPEEVGISWTPRSYVYFQQQDSFMISTFLWKIADSQKFEESFPSKAGVPSKSGKIKYFAPENEEPDNSDFVIGWNHQVVSLMIVQGDNDFVHQSIPYTDTARYEKIEKMQKTYTQTLRKVALSRIENALKPAKSPIATHTNYQKFMKNQYDLGLWLNFEKLGTLLEEQKGAFPIPMQAQQIQQFANKLSGLQQGFLHGFVHLNNGEMRLETQSFMPERLDKLAQKVYQKRLDASLFKYTKGKNPLFYAGMSLDLAQLLAFTEEYYRMTLEGDSIGDVVLSAWDVLDIAIDQEELTSLVRGDFLVSVTGVKNITSTYTSYEYDENFNATEVEKTREVTFPVMTALVKIGNEKNVKKLIKFAEALKGLEKKDDYYIIAESEKEIGGAYVRIKDGILILSNDEAVISGKYKNGVPKSEQLSAVHQQLLRTHSTVYNLDALALLNKLEELGKNELTEKNKQQVELLKSNIEYIRVQGTDPSQNYKNEIIISFKDKGTYFLKQLGVLLEELEKL